LVARSRSRCNACTCLLSAVCSSNCNSDVCVSARRLEIWRAAYMPASTAPMASAAMVIFWIVVIAIIAFTGRTLANSCYGFITQLSLSCHLSPGSELTPESGEFFLYADRAALPEPTDEANRCNLRH